MPSRTNTSGTCIDALIQVDLRFPDEMSPEELADFRAYVKQYRQGLGV